MDIYFYIILYCVVVKLVIGSKNVHKKKVVHILGSKKPETVQKLRYSVPEGWKCSNSWYNTDDGCDCGCGIVDPDCDRPDMATVYCGNGFGPTAHLLCDSCIYNSLEIPEDFKCPSSFYNSNDGCDCNCGAIDPDCLRPEAESGSIYCTSNFPGENAAVCDGHCSEEYHESNEEYTTEEEEDDDDDEEEEEYLSKPYDSNDDDRVPNSWKCNPDFYGGDDGCDCGCGDIDPDCFKAENTEVYCGYGYPTIAIHALCESCEDSDEEYSSKKDETDEEDYSSEENVDGEWRCSSAYYDTGDGCDCGCGKVDPDCYKPGQQLYCGYGFGGSDSVERCAACGDYDGNEEYSESDESYESEDIEIPEDWKCSPAWYAAHDGCDCNCGAIDPDCDMILEEDQTEKLASQLVVFCESSFGNIPHPHQLCVERCSNIQTITERPTSAAPTHAPSVSPTQFPTKSPSIHPTLAPTQFPTTASPTTFPTTFPSIDILEEIQTQYPTRFPSKSPTGQPTARPSSSSL